MCPEGGRWGAGGNRLETVRQGGGDAVDCLTLQHLSHTCISVVPQPLREPDRVPLVIAETVCPGATMSGLMRPSVVGPKDEKEERSSNALPVGV